MLEIVITMFVVLFAFLAGGLWIGWTLAVTGTVCIVADRLLGGTGIAGAAASSTAPSPMRRCGSKPSATANSAATGARKSRHRTSMLSQPAARKSLT